MALLTTPSFNSTQYHEYQIASPGSGGINLNDLIFELQPNQSPNMLNMMYRGGHLCKRYGQSNVVSLTEYSEGNDVWKEYNINDIGYYDNRIYLATENGVMSAPLENIQDIDMSASMIGKSPNCIFCFDRKIYIFEGYGEFYVHDLDNPGVSFWRDVEPYVPDVVINRKPDGSYSDPMDEYNRMGAGFKNSFHGDGTSTVYYLTDKELDDRQPIVEVFEEILSSSDYTFDRTKGTVTFNTAPPKGTNNVVITAYKTVEEEHFTGKYFIAYGGANNSRLFIGGCGNGEIYYSGVFDASYFPYSNHIKIGNDEDDVVGFGEQYDVLMVFKPREIFSLDYSLDSEGNVFFAMKLVNSEIGCDAPKSIQLINNQLTWLSSTYGVCTLVSTSIEDERNVRVISRNIDSRLLQEVNLENAVSVDWDNKYLIAVNGHIYLWDYLMTPYVNTGKLDNDAKRIAWFFFDNCNVDLFIKTKNDLYFTHGCRINVFNNEFSDFGEPIHAVYQTPYIQFDAVSYLKTVKNIFVQTLADEAAQIDITYFTEENPNGDKETEPIRIYDKLWTKFTWNTFGWQYTNIVNTFRRKCSLKKIQTCSVLFENNELYKNMPLSHISFQYALVKNIK